MKFNDEISLGFIYIGTLIGAGFASGQEIMSFFTIYGKGGLLGIIVVSVFFFILGYFILSESLKHQSKCVRDILLSLAGERLMLLFDIMIDIFCLAGYCIMVAGCGAVLEESMNLHYMPMVILFNIGMVLALKQGMSTLAGLNKILVSIILIITLLIGLTCLKERPNVLSDLKILPVKRGWFISALVYVSYNITLALVVLASLGTYTRRIRAAIGAAVFGVMGLFMMAITMWLITTVNFPSLARVQIPLLWVARRQGQLLYIASIAILLSAMTTTALSLGFSFAQGLSRRYDFRYSDALNFLLLGIPFAGYGFAGLISKIYPLFGFIGIFFGILLILRRFLIIKIE